MNINTLEKLEEEKLVFTFNFSGGLEGAETLIGTPSATMKATRGVAASVTTMVGVLQLGPDSKTVLVPVSGGKAGAQYKLRVVADTTNSNKRLAKEVILQVL